MRQPQRLRAVVTMGLTAVRRAVKSSLYRARNTSRLVGAYAYDGRRFLRYSSTLGPFRSRDNLAAKITERYHGIEKGLSLPAPRPGFGVGVLATLIRLVNVYLESYGEDDVTSAAIGALREYREFCTQHMPVDEVPFAREITELEKRCRANPPGISGTRTMTRESVVAQTSQVDLGFFTSRHSTRIFAQEPVTEEEIRFAEAAARSAPAVCNRQFGGVRAWRDRESIDRLLAIQGGARGFGDNVPALALITVSLRSYWGAGERHQGWVDGGLFAMNFILGLHAQGLGTVALNWSKDPSRDRLLRAELSELVPEEAVIMFVAFGHLPSEYRVAASPRRISR